MSHQYDRFLLCSLVVAQERPVEDFTEVAYVTMSNGSLRPRATISCKNPFQFA